MTGLGGEYRSPDPTSCRDFQDVAAFTSEPCILRLQASSPHRCLQEETQCYMTTLGPLALLGHMWLAAMGGQMSLKHPQHLQPVHAAADLGAVRKMAACVSSLHV